MNLFKRTTASVALVTLVSGLFVTGVSAYSPAELEAANALAAKNVINAKSNAADYNLDANVLRQEIFKVGAGVAGLSANTSCENKFGDVSALTPNTWVCGYAEALLAKGMLSANANARPGDNISKAEAVKLMLETAGHTGIYTDAAKWQEQVVAYAAAKGVVASFSDYGTAATRGFVFGAANNAMAEEATEDEIDLGELLGLNDDDEDDAETPTDGGETETPTVSGSDELEVSLAASTPAGATVPGAISGLPVAKYDFTAGSEDVTISSLVVKRKGLSDDKTIEALAVFTEEGRASKAKNDSQENDTEATLTLSNGGVVVKAGETRTITVVADIAATADANGDEFAIELIEVTANTTVELDGALVANTMEVGGVDAAKITIEKDGSVSDVKVGDEAVEIFKFAVDGATDEDVILKTITFKGEGSVDEENEIMNYVLEMEGKEVATTASANGKYVTFNLEDGVTIDEDKNVSFTVLADIVSGVTETIAFKVDKTLDVSAEGTKYGYGASVVITDVDADGDLGTVSIDAGELTLSDMDAPSDKIRADKKNVELGSVKVTNVSGAELELQKLAVSYAITSSSAAFDSAIEVFENFEVVVGGTVYELDLDDNSVTLTSGTYSDTDLDIILAEGTTDMVIRADTKENVPADVTVDISVNNVAGDGFYVVETEEDEKVSDITPSSLSFKKVTFITSGATLSAVPLANVTVVRGAENVVVNQFEIEAEEASKVLVDEIKANVVVTDGGTAVNFATSAANLFVSEVALYRGSVSDSNLLDSISGAKISSTGEVTFDGFDVEIAADAEETFVITVSIVDGTDAQGKVVKVNVNTLAVSADDDDNDDVTVNGSAIDNKEITVTSEGSVTLTADAGNDANEDVKTILAGNSETVYSIDVQAQNEEADVETVTFTVDQDLSKAVSSASLYLDGSLITTNTNSDFKQVVASTTPATAGNVETQTITVTNVATANGVVNIAGDSLSTTATILSTDSAIEAAVKIAAAIDANGAYNAAVPTTAAITVTSVAFADVSALTVTNDTTFVPTAFTSSVVETTPGVAPTAETSTYTSTIAFDNLTSLIIKEESAELELKLNTANIGHEKVGEVVQAANVTNIAFTNVDGVDSGKDITVAAVADTSKDFAIVPAVVTPSVVASLNSSTTPQIKLSADAGSNTVSNSNTTPDVAIDEITFSLLGTTIVDGNVTFTLVNNDDTSVSTVTATATTGTTSITFDLTDGTFDTAGLNKISNGSSETFKVVVTNTEVDEDTIELTLPENGILYDVDTTTGITTNLSTEIDFGSRTY